MFGSLSGSVIFLELMGRPLVQNDNLSLFCIPDFDEPRYVKVNVE